MTSSPPLILQAGSGSLSRLPRHRNQGLEIVYLEKGTLQWEVEGRMETVRPGSVFFTLPWERHGSTHEYEPGHRWHFVIFSSSKSGEARNFKLPASLLFSKKESYLVCTSLLKSSRRCLPGSPALAFLIPQLVREYTQSDPNGQSLAAPVLASLSTLILAELSRILSGKTSPLPLREARRVKVRKFLQELDSSCENTWTLASMAEACGIRRSHFSRLVQEISGDSPLTYLRRLRIERARLHLRHSSQSITEIALACGFESSQHFARIFRQFTGMTAQEYRKKPADPLSRQKTPFVLAQK